MSDTRPQNQPDEAMVDLLIKQVTEGLSPAEQRALDVLDTEVASVLQKDLERAAAAVILAGSAGGPALPSALADRLAQQAAQHFSSTAKVADLSAARAAAAMAEVSPRVSQRTQSKAGAYAGWLAAAACLVLAIVGWQRTPAPAPVAVVIAPTPVIPPEKPVPTLAEERSALLAKSDSLKITLGPTKDPAAAGMTGDVVWDPVAQRGFLHFAGLAANDPAVHQYQIWIFDAGRDKRYPVDGGVFDVPANVTEVVIPIRAALMVLKPAAFAVTVEKPGGVVVSGREHVVALGAANPS
jgi:Anti-sigma-K factor rskA